MYNHHKRFGLAPDLMSPGDMCVCDSVCVLWLCRWMFTTKACQLGPAASDCWSSVLVLEEFPSWSSMQSEASAESTLPETVRLLQNVRRYAKAFVKTHSCQGGMQLCTCQPRHTNIFGRTAIRDYCARGSCRVYMCTSATAWSCHQPWPNIIHLTTDKGISRPVGWVHRHHSAQLNTSNNAWYIEKSER